MEFVNQVKVGGRHQPDQLESGIILRLEQSGGRGYKDGQENGTQGQQRRDLEYKLIELKQCADSVLRTHRPAVLDIMIASMSV